MKAAVALAAFATLGGCVSPPGPSMTLAPGRWGGDQIALELRSDGSGHIDMSCAAADFAGPVALDVGGHFLTAGRYTQGTGVATIEPTPSRPANISGRVDGDGVLWLDIALRDSYPVRSARLKRGVEPILTRCL